MRQKQCPFDKIILGLKKTLLRLTSVLSSCKPQILTFIHLKMKPAKEQKHVWKKELVCRVNQKRGLKLQSKPQKRTNKKRDEFQP